MTGLSKLGPLFALALSLCIAGCTVIGAGIGLMIDSAPPDSVEVAKSELKSVRQGGWLSLHLDDFSRHYGRYNGLSEVTTKNDVALCESRRRDLLSKIRLPTFGDSVTVAISDGQLFKGQFIRFSGGSISLKATDQLEPVNFWLSQISSVETQDGNKTAATDLQELFTNDKIPKMTYVMLESKSDAKAYPIERIKAIYAIHPGHTWSNAWIYGAIIGAVVDVLVVQAITKAPLIDLGYK